MLSTESHTWPGSQQSAQSVPEAKCLGSLPSPHPLCKEVRLCLGWSLLVTVLAHPCCQEDASSLTSVFLAVMFRLYDSDENGLLDQAVSSPDIPPGSEKGWGRGEHVEEESENSLFHLYKNSNVSVETSERSRALYLLFPKSQPGGQ